MQERYRQLSLAQQDELIALCATDAEACAARYQVLVDDSMLFREALDGLGGREIPWRIGLDSGPLLGQYLEAESVVSQEGFAQFLQEQHGLDHEQASQLAALSASAIAGVARSGALRAAKRDVGISQSRAPDAVNRVYMTDRNGNPVLDSSGRPIMTREYIYTRQDGTKVVIQEHSAGHQFGQGGIGDQGPHFNVRPPENTRTGSVPGARDHYSW